MKIQRLCNIYRQSSSYGRKSRIRRRLSTSGIRIFLNQIIYKLFYLIEFCADKGGIGTAAAKMSNSIYLFSVLLPLFLPCIKALAYRPI